MRSFIGERQAYAMTFWAVFFGLVLVPILGLAIELGRYFYAIAEVQKAADAAALAAAAEMDQQIFQETGRLVPTARAWRTAQVFVGLNTSGLSARGVRAYVTGIHTAPGENRVEVTVSADLSILFPSVVPRVLVSRIGVAKLRAMTY